jgi:predicted outer membrane protein
MARFGIWYDDGRMDFGWLNHEGRHGRPYRAEYLSLEEAQRAAELEEQYDKKTVFYATDIDADHQKLFKTVRDLVKRRRLERAEAELESAKAAMGTNARKSAYQHILDDEDD